jgi:subtilisin family serine protease
VRLLLAAAAASAVLALPSSAAAFAPSDPLAAGQWYLAADRAFDFWSELPTLPPVKVAVIDSGIDLGHPDLAGRVVAARSFVSGDVIDRDGHGTFVAGEIAAALNNGQGIAGIAFPAALVIAKVVRGDGTISPDAEARAIRWAVDEGARVINLSLGGLRDPVAPDRDTFSTDEETAIEYAASRGVVLVAAVGNGDQAPSSPWRFASYPAALPHVIGVGALAQDGTVPSFSNRDPIYVDLVAPGQSILSTLPRSITAERPSCADQGYSSCGPPEFKAAAGTSFAAPQVSAAAALLLAVKPELRPEQVAQLLYRSAVDLPPAGRDGFSGWGKLDIAGALQAASAASATLPLADRLEANDDAGVLAPQLYGRRKELTATIDYWDDNRDVYRIRLRAGQRIWASVHGPPGTDVNLVLWKPGTRTVEGFSARLQARRATQSAGAGPHERFAYRASVGGWYYLEVKIAQPGSGAYTLRYAKGR